MSTKHDLPGRRKWLKVLSMGTFGAFFTGTVPALQMRNSKDPYFARSSSNRQLARKCSPVSIVKGNDHYEIILHSLRNIEQDVIKSIGNKTILIKPNMVLADIPACATDPLAVQAILDFLKPHFSGQILIGESTAAFKDVTTLDLFDQYGYTYLKDEYNVKFVDLNTAGHEYRHILGADNKPKFIRVTKPFLDPDVFIISAAKMKTHSQCIVTLSLKNVLMAAPVNDYQKSDWKYGDKFDMHVFPGAAANSPLFYNLFQMAHYVYPDLAVIDGYEGMEGNGPGGGTPIASRIAIASLDALAADTIGATVMGFDPDIIPYLRFIKEGGFGIGDIDNIEVIGTPVSQCKMKFKPSDESAEVFNLT